MNSVLDQNEKVLEKMQTGSNSYTVKTTLGGRCSFKMLLPFQVLKITLVITLSHTVESTTNGSN